jgi:23S rRNA pseudouridine1911/1915/1917 synthase
MTPSSQSPENGAPPATDATLQGTSWRTEAGQSAAGLRLDAFLAAELEGQGISREKVKSWIKAGKLLLDGRVCRKPNTRLAGGEALELSHEPEHTPLTPESGSLDILHQERRFLVLDKPAGLTVHPAPGLPAGTLVHRLLHEFPELARMEGLRPGIVHRIDKDTSGLLLVALDEQTRQELAQAFARRSVHKEYLTLVAGVPAPPEGVIDLPMGRHPLHKVKMAVLPKGGKPARSDYRVLHQDPLERFSLLGVRIHTGRTHQIRVHLSHLGRPILGDRLYGVALTAPSRCKKLAPRQMLHAWRLGFEHPDSRERLDFQRPPPKDFLGLALCLSRRVQRVVIVGMPGCGKSSLARLLESSGAPLFSADAVVAALYEPGEDGWHFVKSRYGEEYLQPGDSPLEQRPVDRKALFQAMRAEDAVRREINAALHPMVRHRLEAFWQAHADHRLALAEVPLFLEAGAQWRELADVVVGVRCPRALRLQRLHENRGWDDQTLAAFESWQWSEDKKLAACDLMVDNDSDEEALQRRALELLHELRELRRVEARTLALRLRRIWGEQGTP